MKKITSLILALLLVLSSFALCYAQSKPDTGIDPQYVGTCFHFEKFFVASNGNASYYAQLGFDGVVIFDKVEVEVQIKDSSERVIFSRLSNAPWDPPSEGYAINDTCQLSSKGIYSMTVKYKCYKNGALIETITADEVKAEY